LILEKMAVGGQIMLSPMIENFPGFPGGISTQELIDRLKRQIEEYNVKVEMEEAVKILADSDLKIPSYNIQTKEKTYEARCIIIASGAQPEKLDVEGEKRLTGRGVSYCATCDGPLFRDKEIAVIGAGDRAIEEAIFLSGYAKRVTVVHRRNQLRAAKILEEKAYQNPKINFMLDSIVEEILGQSKVEAVKIRNIKTSSLNELACQGVFIFVGIRPDTAFLNNQLELNEMGFIITNQDLETSKKGIFACGDCRQKSLYQVITACSDGAVAAASVHRYLVAPRP
jgi:thioredoxin reductase (NADPH)